jgi:hypothetical protein
MTLVAVRTDPVPLLALRHLGPTRTEIEGVHSDHRRSNPFGLFLNAPYVYG